MGWIGCNAHKSSLCRGTARLTGRTDSCACNFELNGAYALTDSLITFFLPLLVMCCTYYRILRIARSPSQALIGSRPACVVTSYDAGGPLVTLAAVIGAFTVCWLPYFILFNVAGVKEQVLSGTLYEVVLWLGYATPPSIPSSTRTQQGLPVGVRPPPAGCRWQQSTGGVEQATSVR
ncbi:unnamed protein product [Boreogadus saida]